MVLGGTPSARSGSMLTMWTAGYENPDGTPIPIDQQHPSYKTLCTVADPDHDGQQECAIGG
jgi:hypothetical protein